MTNVAAMRKSTVEQAVEAPVEDITERFRDYQFRVNWYSSQPYNVESEAIDVRITTKDGEEYQANFTTRKFLDYLFEKNKRTGECASGTYFCMPGMIVVERLTDENIKRTIDDLVERLAIKNYFTKLEYDD